jgi:hypothetical protein
MSDFVVDSFTVEANTPLESHVGEIGAGWVLHPAYSSKLRVLSSDDRLIPNGTGTGSTGYYAPGIPASNEYGVYKDVIYLSTSNDGAAIGITARMSTTLATFYMARHDRNSNTWQLYRAVNNAFTLLGTYGQVLASGVAYRMGLIVHSSGVQLLVDGVERISSPDTTITAVGRAGIRWNLNGSDSYNARSDNFVATNLGTPPSGFNPAWVKNRAQITGSGVR